MSHNKIKIGTAEADRTGLISPDLNDLGNVSGEASDNQILKYTSASSSWGPATASSNIARVVFSSWTGQGVPGTGTANYDQNDNVIWRNGQFRIDDSTYASRTSSSGSLVPAPSSSWTQYWTLKTSGLDGKTVRCEAVHMGKALTGAEYIRYQWGVGSSNLATFTPIGNVAEQNEHYTTAAFGHYEVGGSDINLALKIESVSGSIGILTATYSLMCHLTLSII